MGIEYSLSPGRPRQIHGALRAAAASPAASELGQQLSDDSLIVSPDGPAARRLGRGALKRDARVRPGSGKRMAISASPSRPLGRHVRKTSLPHVDWDSPRERGQQLSTEERLQALERRQATGAAEMAKVYAVARQLEQQVHEHTKMGVDLRRDVFNKFGTVAEQMAIIENKFAGMEAALDAKIAEIDLKIGLLHRQAETQRPTDGRVVAEGFGKLAADIEALKQWSGTVFTKGMGQELEGMRQRGFAHGNSIEELTRKSLEAAAAAAYFQSFTDGIGAAMVAQDGRVGGLEQHTAQLTSAVEALRIFQEG